MNTAKLWECLDGFSSLPLLQSLQLRGQLSTSLLCTVHFITQFANVGVVNGIFGILDFTVQSCTLSFVLVNLLLEIRSLFHSVHFFTQLFLKLLNHGRLGIQLFLPQSVFDIGMSTMTSGCGDLPNLLLQRGTLAFQGRDHLLLGLRVQHRHRTGQHQRPGRSGWSTG